MTGKRIMTVASDFVLLRSISDKIIRSAVVRPSVYKIKKITGGLLSDKAQD